LSLLAGIEDSGQHSRVDPLPGVLELDDEQSSLLTVTLKSPIACMDCQRAASGRELGRVANQVPGNLHDPRVVALDGVVRSRQVELHFQTGARSLITANLHGLPYRLVNINQFA